MGLLAAFSVLAVAAATPSRAQNYPDRPIRAIVPLPPGGSVDVIARLLQPSLEKALGQSLIVDNRSGASGVIGANAVATAAPDGYTLLLAPTTFSITAALHPKLPFDPMRAFRPVAVLCWSAQLVLVNPKVEANSLKELAALAKAHPNKINYSTPGASSQAHLLFEQWSIQAGIKMQHVPYRGGAPALMAAVSGETQVTAISSSVALAQVQAKALRALATGGSKREPQLPDVPTTAEAGFPDFKAQQWIGLFAPGGTPDEVVARLNTEINRALDDSTVQARLAEQGLIKAGGSPEDFRALLENEIKQWKDVARASNIKMQ
jgi:tripartite-type tricarboxylate transporter receptor subunit TctC